MSPSVSSLIEVVGYFKMLLGLARLNFCVFVSTSLSGCGTIVFKSTFFPTFYSTFKWSAFMVSTTIILIRSLCILSLTSISESFSISSFYLYSVFFIVLWVVFIYLVFNFSVLMSVWHFSSCPRFLPLQPYSLSYLRPNFRWLWIF